MSALLGLAYHYVDEEIVKAILEELSMANPLQTLIDEREAQAEIKGKREALRTFLYMRFGPLPESVEQRIAVADLEQMNVMVGRAAIIESLDAL